MEIIRIDTYQDSRFPQEALYQHGCYLANGVPYWFIIQSPKLAVIFGSDPAVYPELIDTFRFYTPQITDFYDANSRLVQSFPAVPLKKIKLRDIQPSQFFVDQAKVAAIGTFVHSWKDIIIQVTNQNGRYIALDGHTRLYYAATMGWTEVLAVEESDASYILGFVNEAINRNIRTVFDMELVEHQEYEEKWNKFCDNYFAGETSWE